MPPKSKSAATKDANEFTATSSTLTEKHELFKILDDNILKKGLTELHTHLMGMGSADLWVSKVMENYLPRIERHEAEARKNPKSRVTVHDKIYYPLSDIMKASGFQHVEGSDFFPFQLDQSLFEALFFDGFKDFNLSTPGVIEEIKREEKTVLCISNETIVKMLNQEDSQHQRRGPFRALVRNWFEFLSASGQAATHTEVLQTYRGQFNPGFYPQRFVIKDSIVETRPEVLGILLNSTCARYAKAGVNYIEYSVSAGDLLKEERFDAMNKMTFTSPMFAPPKEVIPSEAASSSSSTSKTSKVKAASVPKVKAAAVPTLPKILQMEDPKPPWRRFVDYKEHSDSQRFVFLAAFTRDKPVGTVYCTIQPNGSWGKQEPPPPSHRDAYGTLGDIAFDTNGISAFLQVSLDRAERDSLPVANVAEENDPLVMHDKTCVRLKALAQVLCRDENVARVYPYLVEPTLDKKGELCPPAIDRLRDKLRKETAQYVTAVVGLDWVGDELGHPFCVFSHDKFVSLVADWMEHHNPRFGVRFHAGEGPIRPSTRNPLNSKLRLAFYLHMYILCEGIKLYHRKMVYWLNTKPKERLRTNIDEWYDNIGSCAAQLRKPNIRIGHGVAFLFGCGDDREANQFNRDMEDFRVFLRKNKIVCELNPTSNHMLLPSTFHTNNSNANKPTLRCFLEEGLPVVLATDDDGIWAIHKCKRHYHHVSVAAEYCQAIERSDILRKVELTEMLWWGRQSAFSALHDSDVQVMPSEVVLRRAAIVDAEGNRIKPDGLELSRSSSLL